MAGDLVGRDERVGALDLALVGRVDVHDERGGVGDAGREGFGIEASQRRRPVLHRGHGPVVSDGLAVIHARHPHDDVGGGQESGGGDGNGDRTPGAVRDLAGLLDPRHAAGDYDTLS